MKPILIVSPIPSHPQNQGNSQRIFTLARLLKAQGVPLHFVYYGMEGISPKQRTEMSSFWDEFVFISPDRPAPSPSYGDHFHVDDWFDERVGEVVSRLSSTYDYSACLVNYVWFSKVLSYLPSSVCKIIDTHDVFGDRHLVAKAAGLEPVWFYTTIEMEALALNRADIVLAIQNEEAAYFRLITDAKVIELGHVIPPKFLPVRESSTIRIGYLGSANPFNVASVEALDKALVGFVPKNIEWCLAGSVTKAVDNEFGHFKNWGFVDSLEDFYREIDVVVNPMIGGTGLKIKSVEALAYGLPLLATPDAMVGVPSQHASHSLNSAEAIVDFVSQLGASDITEQAANSRQVYQDYCNYQLQNLKDLISGINDFA